MNIQQMFFEAYLQMSKSARKSLINGLINKPQKLQFLFTMWIYFSFSLKAFTDNEIIVIGYLFLRNTSHSQTGENCLKLYLVGSLLDKGDGEKDQRQTSDFTLGENS